MQTYADRARGTNRNSVPLRPSNYGARNVGNPQLGHSVIDQESGLNSYSDQARSTTRNPPSQSRSFNRDSGYHDSQIRQINGSQSFLSLEKFQEYAEKTSMELQQLTNILKEVLSNQRQPQTLAQQSLLPLLPSGQLYQRL